ncbi:hypothetical protein AJ80_02891 [Polytolypa hystricis UAMH7299]|uniref:Asteroid domain-containing protein n=1 Tax=Polytolypa hystricis (strain UAMH7299) TaxID=1447883 RepID=A0A2B7YMZ7_POLH7|nr:hypothetical protein AJ80_02891 [Polytolypa hystricis UAMH7299]
MGIPHLTRHLLPYAERVQLNNIEDSADNARRITSVVVDGPALVYHVYFCLLSWMGEQYSSLDAQPSSDEVSIGVMRFLLHLRDLNINIQQIYFDGGLPLSKRDTRLSRMEKSRMKLESFCRDSAGGFKTASIRRTPLHIDPAKVFSRRRIPARALPETTFMTPTVIEDLKYRWNWSQILEYIPDRNVEELDPEAYIWANITEVVPGEADIYCAETARQAGAAVLTGDSDLLVHDLGPDGSVIFLDSIEVADVQAANGSALGIRAMEICPRLLEKKLGVNSIQRLAYELKRDPHVSFQTLVQRSKGTDGTVEGSVSFISFMKEYHPLGVLPESSPARRLLDSAVNPKMSELCVQYAVPGLVLPNEPRHVYLPILIENHARGSAWSQGTEIRLIAYSILNLSVPGEKRSTTLLEHARRGRRIAPVPIALPSQKETEKRLESLIAKITSIRRACNDHHTPLNLWKSFSVYEILSRMDPDERPSPGNIHRFLKQDYCGDKLTWDDIHLYAQIQAILYSLKSLKPLVHSVMSGLEGKLNSLAAEVGELLVDLPPMRILMKPRQDALVSENSIKQLVEEIFGLLDEHMADQPSSSEKPESEADGQYGSNNRPRNGDVLTAEVEKQWTTAPRKKRKAAIASAAPVSSKPKHRNMYDILGGM